MTGRGGSAVGLEQRLLARLRLAGIPADVPLVVAFSGGPDSLALAAALTHCRAVTGMPIRLVHVDHALRKSSPEEASAAAKLGEQLGLEVIRRRVPSHPLELHPAGGLEDAARRERYRLLQDEAHRVRARFVATGHHREDQAETVLLHLLRGSGLHGAAGMAELAALPAVTPDDISQESATGAVRLWRPFLGEPRSQILEYLRERNLTPLDDPSNDDVSLRRNALRLKALPELEAVFPGTSAALARFALLASEEDQFLESLVDLALGRLIAPWRGMRLAALRGEPRALQRRVLRRWLVDATGVTTIGAERVDAVLHWANSEAAKGRIELPGKWWVRCDREWLIVERGNQGREGDG